MKKHIKDESIDLIYLDPPFNSNATYNVLFKTKSDTDSPSQLQAFTDTWEWGPVARDYHNKLVNHDDKVSEIISGLKSTIGTNNMMAYLVMMTIRLIQLHRVLKDTGAIYLHCDPTASHYLKIMMDAIFGTKNFRNEIIWKRVSGSKIKNPKKRSFDKNTDTILYYAKSDKHEQKRLYYKPSDHEKDFPHIDTKTKRRYKTAQLVGGPAALAKMGKNQFYEYKGYKPKHGWFYIKSELIKLDEAGYIRWNKGKTPRRIMYYDEHPGIEIGSLWDDIKMLTSNSKERLGYQTQKPLELLERIIKSSSKEGDLILDPFCGCGTAVHAAHKLKRNYIGIDITHLAIGLIEYRMRKEIGIKPKVIGVPTTLESAQELANRDKFQFEAWAVTRIDGIKPNEKKGKDRGIDGRGIRIIGKDKNGLDISKKVIVSVKGGHQISPSMIRDLKGTVKRENAGFGVFICIQKPTKEMKKEAASSDMIDTNIGHSYPQIQIYTIDDYFEGKKPDLPPAHPQD